jgi:hypothetical protein
MAVEGVGSQDHAPAALHLGKTRYQFYRKLTGPQSRSRRVRKISLPLIFEPCTVQPVPSRYTDCAIPAHVLLYYILQKLLLWESSILKVSHHISYVIPVLPTKWHWFRSRLKFCSAILNEMVRRWGLLQWDHFRTKSCKVFQIPKKLKCGDAWTLTYTQPILISNSYAFISSKVFVRDAADTSGTARFRASVKV